MKNYQYLCCPSCQSILVEKKTALICSQCHNNYPIKDGIVCFGIHTDTNFQFSYKAWDTLYKQQLKNGKFKHEFEEYQSNYFEDTYRQLTTAKPLWKNAYLEIGCGPCYMGQLIAKECKIVIGVDISFSALRIAKKMFTTQGINNYLLIQGDIRQMPIKDNTIDLIYGGGVIEHFKETQVCVAELYRVLQKGGVSLNSVPMCNIGSLTYRQVWGNIPNVMLLRPLAEFIHMRLLKGRHMKFGYEMSFTRNTLNRIHRNAGFKNVHITRFDAKLFFEFLPSFLRPVSSFLAIHSSLFWPMIKAVAVKT